MPGSGVSVGKFYEFGGGNPFLRQGRMQDALLSPDTTGVTVAYDPASNTWGNAPSLNQARSFPGGTNVGDTLVAAGGYTGATTTNATETMTPGGPPPPPPPPTAAAGDWTPASPYPLNNVRYAFGQNGETMYVVGGVADGTRVPDTNKYDATTDTWSPLAPIPVASEAPAGAYLDGKLYVAEGDTGDSFNIYDIASNTWSTGAPRPGSGQLRRRSRRVQRKGVRRRRRTCDTRPEHHVRLRRRFQHLDDRYSGAAAVPPGRIPDRRAVPVRGRRLQLRPHPPTAR